MTYSMLASGSCLLTDVVEQLHEDTKKVNSVERLTRHLNNGTSFTALKSYLTVIRLTAKRKLFFHGKWVPATQLRNQRNGKIKTVLTYKGKKHHAYLSHVKVQITASKKDIYLVLVYGITEHPMMLATNKKIKSKEDVVSIALTYFSRWRIEEYFRSKKQMFQFENFRVRKLAAIIQKADPIKGKVQFSYYRLAKGIFCILSYAKEGIRLWFRTKRPAYRQLCLKLTA